MNNNYDAILIISFGGPEGMNDVIPFLDNVLRNRNVPERRKLEVAKHYQQFGGISPINRQNRELIRLLKDELTACNIELPIYWGNRNWHPFLNDTVRQMSRDGIERALAFVTSAYSSYSGCRQYREDILEARRTAGPNAPVIDKIRAYYNHPGFIDANVDRIRAAFNRIPESRRQKTILIFTAHSLPLAMASRCTYEQQLKEICDWTARDLNLESWNLVYQSRSGPADQPWLGPDVCEDIRSLASRGVTDVVVSPIGFVSDHMEIVFDLDTEARQLCTELNINMELAETVGTHPKFIAVVRELIRERLSGDTVRRTRGQSSPLPDRCADNCCLKS